MSDQDANQLAMGWDEAVKRYETLQRDFSEFVTAVARAARFPMPTSEERWADAMDELPAEIEIQQDIARKLERTEFMRRKAEDEAAAAKTKYADQVTRTLAAEAVLAEEIRRFLQRYVQRQDKPPKKQRRV